MLKREHAELLESRGVSLELLSRLGVESGDGDWIKIPYVADGKVVNIKHRTIAGQKQFRQEKDARKCFWNLDILKDETLKDMPLIITEGEFDAMIAMECGFVRVISVPDGAPAEAIGDKETQKYTYLDDAGALLENVKEIILATDGDGPGINLMNDLALRLGKARCKWVRYPKGCKDLNEAWSRYGEKGVHQTIAKAAWCKVDGVYRMNELPPVVEPPVFEIGMPGLSEHYKIRPGDLTIVTGIPGHGKSSFLNDVACHMVSRHGWNVCFASFEQEPQTDHRRNLRTWHGRKWVKDMSQDELKKADQWIEANFSFICPDDDDQVSLNWVLERAAAAVLRYGAKMIIIDPWNEMDHVRPKDVTLTEYTGFAIKAFRLFAKKYKVHVVVAAHPAKQQKKPDGTYPIPTLYDISDSQHWYNKATVGIVVHREKEKTIIRIAKSKYHNVIGKPGDLEVSFDLRTNRYDLLTAATPAASYSCYGDD